MEFMKGTCKGHTILTNWFNIDTQCSHIALKKGTRSSLKVKLEKHLTRQTKRNGRASRSPGEKWVGGGGGVGCTLH